MTTATESVLAPFAGKLERWNGNIAPENDSAFRTDGVLIFLLARCIQMRGTHTRNDYRSTTEEMCENEWRRMVDQATIEWTGDWHAVDYSYIEGAHLEADGVEAYADRRYLALAHRLLAPDRVTFSDGKAHHRCPSIVFHRDGGPVGALAQLRPLK